MKPTENVIAGEQCWVVENDTVRLAVTKRGRMTAPVTFFHASKRPVEPYYISPWQGERAKIDEPVLVPLRGDFFCLPFGAGGKLGTGAVATHGEPATRVWGPAAVERLGRTTQLSTTMSLGHPAGRVTKRIVLVDGQSVLYVQHELSDFQVNVPLGHHATLAGGESDDRWSISTSPILFGRVSPSQTAPESGGEYRSLAAGSRFTNIEKVPTIWKSRPYESCATFPARRGFCDIIQVFSKPGPTPAWTAAVCPADGFLWFSLKDQRVLPSTVFWMEHRGRHASPWSGRNSCIGLEDVCAYFAEPATQSIRRNELNEAGIPTSIRLQRRRPTFINNIQGVVRVPKGFRRVARATFRPDGIVFRDRDGRTAFAAVRHAFVYDGLLSGQVRGTAVS